MKFADKYEILEMVTSGRVSTFLARERASQEPVVVYMFECGGSGAELSTASIIARFCSLAPNPPGIIVKAGFDDPSSSAFITTKMPDSAALQAWVAAYHAFGKPEAPPSPEKPASPPAGEATAELSAWEVRSVLAKNTPPQKQPPVEPLAENPGGSQDGGTAVFSLSAPTRPAPPRAVPHSGEPSGGEFTRLFREVNAFAPVKSNEPPTAPAAPKPANATDAIFGERLGAAPLGGEKFTPVQPPQTPVAPAPVEPSPGSFTREFMGLSSESVAPAPRQTAPVPRAPAPTDKEPGAFTREFMAISQDAFKNPEPSVPPVESTPPAASFDSIFGGASSPAGGVQGAPDNQKSGAGEFTSFFRDPFEHPGAPSKSIEIPDLATSEPTKPQTGEFTRMFGRDDIARDAPAPLPPVEREAPPSAPGSFTQIFGEIQPGKTSEASKLGSATLGTNPNLRPSFLEPSGSPPELPRSAAPPAPAAPQADSFFARTPAPFTPPANQTFMNRPGSTTDVFRMPGGDAPPVEQAPSGPSEFTVFLSRSQINASLPSEPAGPPANAAGGAPLPGFAPPPSPFQFAPPPPPPAPPAMKLPPMPAAPAVPRPAAPSVAPKPGSIWPLITVLTILGAIGILLVMYFAFKR